jgi:Ser/Thr protein kinase RdoA (MazF antagonist)
VIPPQTVLKHYGPELAGLRWNRVAGGFSGALVWRGDDPAGSPVVALKAWPTDYPAVRLKQIHFWMSQAEHLRFVPSVLRTTTRATFVEEAGRVWDVTRWMPGLPRSTPSEEEVTAACAAIAPLHRAWGDVAVRLPCPGVSNRLRVLREWHAVPMTSEVTAGFLPSLKSLLLRAADLARSTAPSAIRSLESWEAVTFRVQPCIRDLRSEHVLFTEAAVTGIVDYGAMAEDHPAVDLARLLGDYSAENEALFNVGLESYRSAGGEIDTPNEFVRILARTGALCSVVMWLLHLGVQRRTYPDTLAVETRIRSLIQRIEHFAPA